MRSLRIELATIGSLLCGTVAFASDPALTCEASKLKAVSKYDACRFKAYSKAVRGQSFPDFTRCSLDRFADAEARADGLCTTVGDQADIGDFVDFCTDSVALALAGGALPVDYLTCADDLAACDASLTSCDGNLATCQGNLSSTNADLGACNGSLGSCNGSLSTCQGNLSSTNADLNACNLDLSATNTDLGICQSSLGTANSGTAAAGDVLATKTFTSSAGIGATGAMPNNGAVAITPSTASQDIAVGYHNGSGSVAGDADLVAANIKSGVELFGVTGTAASAGVTKTGQSLCYNASGTQISCVGSGQDGAQQNGVSASFTDNGNGTISDNRTGLMWEKLSDDGSIHDKDTTYDWTTALTTKIASLNSGNFASHNDWRLPNIRELETLKNFGAVNPATFTSFNTSCMAGCTVLTCSCTFQTAHWSSTTDQFAPATAWTVGFGDGDTNNRTKTDALYVRAVRGGF